MPVHDPLRRCRCQSLRVFHEALSRLPAPTEKLFKWLELKRDHRACLFSEQGRIIFFFFTSDAFDKLPKAREAFICDSDAAAREASFGLWHVSTSGRKGSANDKFSMVSFLSSGCCSYAIPEHKGGYVVDGSAATIVPFFSSPSSYKKLIKCLPLVVPDLDVASRPKRRKLDTSSGDALVVTIKYYC